MRLSAKMSREVAVHEHCESTDKGEGARFCGTDLLNWSAMTQRMQDSAARGHSQRGSSQVTTDYSRRPAER